MAQPHADRNLLFGILALQLDFIRRDQLVAGMNAWVLDKHKPLGLILVEQQALAPRDQEALELLVDRHLEHHNNQPQRSLAAVSLGPDLHESLNEIGDADLHAGLAQVPTTIVPYATGIQLAGVSTDRHGGAEAAVAVGEPSSSGLRFRVLRPHAVGGLGQVSVARDCELHRDVALKEIKPQYADDAEARARFLAEAEVTGALEHPGVVPVYALGRFQDGRPFYAMRFVQGDSLLEAIDRFHAANWKNKPSEQALALRGLLRRFVDVCNAVAYAHSRGLLHRDLKPANVLLGPYGETLLVDWGLAKALPQEEGKTSPPAGFLRPTSGAAVVTQAGALVGTPSYMAPEQAGGQAVGPAADVYGLGATLYHVLVGRAPFTGPDVVDILTHVVQGQCPPARQVNPAVPPALSAICQKAMALEPANRYGSAKGLAAEVERWLADELVAAYRERWPQRLARWARRHRPVVVGAATLLLTAVVGVSLFALHERKRLGQIEKANDILLSVFRDLDPNAEEKEGLPLRAQLGERLDRAAELLEGEAVGEPLAVARLQMVLGETERSLGFAERAIALQTKARQTLEAKLGPDHPDTLQSMNNLAEAYHDAGHLDDLALPLYEQTLEKRKAKLGPDHPDTLQSMNNLADAYYDAGQLDKAVPLFEQTLEKQKAKLGPDHPETLICMHNLADAYRAAGQLDKAVPLLEQALEKKKAKFGPDHYHTLISMNALALAYQHSGQLDKALPLFQQTLEKKKAKLGPDHPATLISMNNLALAYRDAGQLDKALPLYEQTLEKRKAKLGPNHPQTLTSMNNLAGAYRAAGQLDKAVPLFEQTLEKQKANVGPDHPTTLICMDNLATAYTNAGQLDKAVPLLEQTLEKFKAKLDPDHPDTLISMDNLAGAYRAAGQLDKAVPLFEQTLEKRKAKLGLDHPRTLITMNRLATALQQVKQHDRALVLWRDLLAIQSRKLAADHADRAATLAGLGRCLLQVHKPAEAEPLLREALTIREKKQADAWETCHTKSLLGGSLLAQKKYADAEPLLLAGYEGMEKRQAKIYFPDKPLLAEALERVIELYEATGKKDQAEQWRQKRAAAKPGQARP
jgi:non-specific serine/threonine protein kinase/serine/threonine-protein kinase